MHCYPHLFPTCQVRVSSFSQSYFLPSLLNFFPPSFLPQQRTPDRSGHCRTPTANSKSQQALPDFNCELQIAVGTSVQTPECSG